MHTPATDPKLYNLSDSTYMLIVSIFATKSRIAQYKINGKIHIKYVKL